MNQKISTLILLLCLLGASLYSILTLHEPSPKIVAEDTRHSSAMRDRAERASLQLFSEVSYAETVNQGLAIESLAKEENTTSKLPLPIKVIGIEAPSLCLLESRGVAAEFNLGDLVFSMPIQVVSIKASAVSLSFNNKVYNLPLQLPNLLANGDSAYISDPFDMSAEEIGTRPQILEHIVQLTDTDFIAQGMIASVGMNPDLFQQAGLQEDDVIERINGYRVDKEQELQQLKSSVRHSDTIVFQVVRKGRRITLYLDIPSEALSISQ